MKMDRLTLFHDLDVLFCGGHLEFSSAAIIIRDAPSFGQYLDVCNRRSRELEINFPQW